MSSSAAVRARAARIVADVAMHGRSLDPAMANDVSDTRQERGLLRSLCYDSVRWYLRLDALLERLLARPNQQLAPEVRALAIVGLCQLLYTDIPAHAAVGETVAATRLLQQPRAAGLINAILRRCQREHAQLLPQVDRDPAVRSAHPRWLVDQLRADWGAQLPGILAANNERPPFWIRVNRLRSSAAKYRAQLLAELEGKGIGIAASMLEGTALLLDRALDVGDLPGFDVGMVSVQDAAAQLAAWLLAPQPGERILDACAAPGGKTGHLLEHAPELAGLVAVDVSPERLERVAQNLQRLDPHPDPSPSRERSREARVRGVPVQLIAGDAAEPAGWWDGRGFDRILLDVPCSATGVIRRHPDIKLLRRAEDVPALALRQSQLLRSLWPLLLPGGKLLYASCSALQAETTHVVADFLAAEPSAREVNREAPHEGMGAVLAKLELPVQAVPGGVGLRIAAGTAAMDGFYYALLEKL